MGRSASKLRRTRSGVVSRRFLAAGIARLSLPAPVPPLRLFQRQPRVSRLRHRRAKDVEAADVLRLPGDFAEFFVKLLRIASRQLPQAADPEHFKVPNHGWSNREQIFDPRLLSGHVNPP